MKASTILVTMLIVVSACNNNTTAPAPITKIPDKPIEAPAPSIPVKPTISAEQIDSILKPFRKEVDDMRGITFYHDKTTSRYNDVNEVSAYIGRETGKTRLWLQCRIRYHADSWLFVDSYMFKVDDETFTYTPDKVERDNYTDVWEWSYNSVNAELSHIINRIVNGKRTTIRYNGRQYYHDRTVTEKEVKALRNVYSAFIAAGGSITPQ